MGPSEKTPEAKFAPPRSGGAGLQGGVIPPTRIMLPIEGSTELRGLGRGEAKRKAGPPFLGGGKSGEPGLNLSRL